jgi:hypothetical protein
MSSLISIKGYADKAIKICPRGTEGEVLELHGILVVLPKQPPKSEILFHDQPKKLQMWGRLDLPKELLRVRSMDEWVEKGPEFREEFSPFIEQEFRRRREGVWFYNNGEPTYITGRHYMMLQWTKLDIGYPQYLAFQREIFLHFAACEADDRCLGQLYTKCRRSGYTNICSSIIVDEGTQVKKKTIGIQSKTGKDAQENIFMKKVIPMFKSYPFFFKPIQDGTTNPRVELAFREPSKRITKKNKISYEADALDTIINWKNTTNNAYDGEKLHLLYLDEAGKWESPSDITEAWRIQRTCLIIGNKVIGKAMVGSTVNPMSAGGKEYKKLWEDSDPTVRNQNGRTKSGLYRIFIPAFEALEGFFDTYGNAVVDNPEKELESIDGGVITMGAKQFLKNERESFRGDAREMNEITRQFPFTEDEAFRDSISGSVFNVGKIYQQIEHNESLFPNPVVKGNFVWTEQDKTVAFVPDERGRFMISWIPPKEFQNVRREDKGKLIAPFEQYGCGGVDSYDLDATVDGRGSKGAMHMFNKFNMSDTHPSNMFVVEYASRPDLARLFYEDVLMCSFFYGYPLLIENNKYGIVRYFEQRGFDGYVLDRPEHLKTSAYSDGVKTKGIPSNSQDIIHAHAQAIESFVFEHVGENYETGNMGKMYFNRTLEDWIGYRIDKRTKFDLTISSGLALLAAQKIKQEKPKAAFDDKKFFRRYKFNA